MPLPLPEQFPEFHPVNGDNNNPFMSGPPPLGNSELRSDLGLMAQQSVKPQIFIEHPAPPDADVDGDLLSPSASPGSQQSPVSHQTKLQLVVREECIFEGCNSTKSYLPSQLKTHTATHTKSYRCTAEPSCPDVVYPLEWQLEKHMEKVHGVPPKDPPPYICPHSACPRHTQDFVRRDNRDQHIARCLYGKPGFDPSVTPAPVRRIEKRYFCPYEGCPRKTQKFGKKDDMDNHVKICHFRGMRMHMDAWSIQLAQPSRPRPYLCPYEACPRHREEFTRWDNRNSHVAICPYKDKGTANQRDPAPFDSPASSIRRARREREGTEEVIEVQGQPKEATFMPSSDDGDADENRVKDPEPEPVVIQKSQHAVVSEDEDEYEDVPEAEAVVNDSFVGNGTPNGILAMNHLDLKLEQLEMRKRKLVQEQAALDEDIAALKRTKRLLSQI